MNDNIKNVNTWDDYKEYVKTTNPEAGKDIEEAEQLAKIVGAVILRRTELGFSQRELAAVCGLPQSSVARIESYKTTPNLSTLIKIMKPLGLTLQVSLAGESCG